MTQAKAKDYTHSKYKEGPITEPPYVSGAREPENVTGITRELVEALREARGRINGGGYFDGMWASPLAARLDALLAKYGEQP